MAKTTNGSSRGKKSSSSSALSSHKKYGGGGLKKTIACATTVAALASSKANARRDVDGAAFLETFDDGLKGWVKSEVEQYTGALLFSFALFSFFFSLSLSLFVCVFRECRVGVLLLERFRGRRRVLNRSKSRGKDYIIPIRKSDLAARFRSLSSSSVQQNHREEPAQK